MIAPFIYNFNLNGNNQLFCNFSNIPIHVTNGCSPIQIEIIKIKKHHDKYPLTTPVDVLRLSEQE